MQRRETPHWWQKRRKQRLVTQYALWREESFSRRGLLLELPPPPRPRDASLAERGGGASSLLGQAEGVLQARVTEYRELVLRMRRFALQGALPPGHPMQGTNALRDVPVDDEWADGENRAVSLDMCRQILVAMLQVLPWCHAV